MLCYRQDGQRSNRLKGAKKMKDYPKVEQLTNDENRGITNQIVLKTDDAIYFQSYDSIVAKYSKDNILTLGCNWDYSRTTMKHLNRFIREYTRKNIQGASEIRKAIDNGQILYDPDMK